ncbi:MAG: alpha/beta hydrolase [Rhodobacteraceae bacterium]|nr:alpha/beta hydrolase [Paracoccaceae bacterium]
MDLNRRMLLGASVGQAIAAKAWAAEPAVKPGSNGSSPPPLKGLIRKGYANSSIGQMHYHYVEPPQDTGKTPIVFFHPNPFSGIYFSYTLEELGKDRKAIAFDSPGYGESARPSKPATMEEVAAYMAEALEDMGYGNGNKVDVSGFHTGAYIAPELAAARPDMVRRVVLSGVPFWEGELREEKRRDLLNEIILTEDGATVMHEWERWVAHRNPLIPLDRAYDLFVKSVTSGKYEWWAYYGVVNYDARPRFQQIEAPVLLLNPSGEALAATTRLVLPLLKNGKLIERPDLPHQIYDIAVPQMAEIYREFLDGPA